MHGQAEEEEQIFLSFSSAFLSETSLDIEEIRAEYPHDQANKRTMENEVNSISGFSPLLINVVAMPVLPQRPVRQIL